MSNVKTAVLNWFRENSDVRIRASALAGKLGHSPQSVHRAMCELIEEGALVGAVIRNATNHIVDSDAKLSLSRGGTNIGQKNAFGRSLPKLQEPVVTSKAPVPRDLPAPPPKPAAPAVATIPAKQLLVPAAIRSIGGGTPGRIAEVAGVPKGSITWLLNELIRRGFVARSKVDGRPLFELKEGAVLPDGIDAIELPPTASMPVFSKKTPEAKLQPPAAEVQPSAAEKVHKQAPEPKPRGRGRLSASLRSDGGVLLTRGTDAPFEIDPDEAFDLYRIAAAARMLSEGV